MNSLSWHQTNRYVSKTIILSISFIFISIPHSYIYGLLCSVYNCTTARTILIAIVSMEKKHLVKSSMIYLLGMSIISAMGGLLFGYDWVVIGGAKPFYEQFFNIAENVSLQGLAMGSALIGCLFGSLFSGKLSDKYGRKILLISAAELFLLTSLGTGYAWNFASFVCFRIMGGFAIGIASSLSPMYIAEIAPARLRGRFVAINQLTIVLGILLAQIVNVCIAKPVPADATGEFIAVSWNGLMGWRWMFWAMTVPSALFLIFSCFLPESPRWLAANGQIEKARTVMSRYSDEQQVNAELKEIKSSSEENYMQGGFRDLFKPSIRKVILIGIVLAIFQQWCGINVIFNYAQEIFSAAGYGVSDTLMNIVVTGITNVVFTIVAMFLVDKVGRRALLIAGAFGLTIIYAILGTAYCLHLAGVSLLIIVVLAIACYAMTLAPVMWIVVSEIFPTKVRGIAMSVATFCLWAASFVLTYTFPALNSVLGAHGTFWLYGVICLLGGIFIIAKVPETRGKSLEEIEKEFIKTK